uniref:Uncharacterized protein n=1 Tax=Ciona intestinalis TaxID=7719 RepID=H2XV70_CIOIN
MLPRYYYKYSNASIKLLVRQKKTETHYMRQVIIN